MTAVDPFFSVIICVKNGEDLLGDALESLQRQTFTSFEVIVVDDSSTDCSREIAASHPVVTRVMEGPGRGLAMARNRASVVARGQYLTYLDHDDLYHPRRLERVASWLAEHPGRLAVYAGVSAFGETDDKKRLKDVEGDAQVDWPKAWLAPGTALDALAVEDSVIDVSGSDHETLRNHEAALTWCAPGAGLFVDREALITIGGFPTQTGPTEDFLMLMNLARYVDIVELDQPTYFYRLRPDSETRRMGMPWPYLSTVAAVRFGRHHMSYERAVGKGRALPRDYILEDLLAAGVRSGLRRDEAGPLLHYLCLLYPRWSDRRAILRRLVGAALRAKRPLRRS